MSKDIYFGLPAGVIGKMKEMYVGLPASAMGKITDMYAGASGGVIHHIYQNALVLNFTIDVKNIDLWSFLSVPTSPITLVVNIATGVRVFCDDLLKASIFSSTNLSY